jgi:pyridoxine 5-phosphate synthase
MTVLSVNLNKIALLRNSRGRNFPNLVDYASQFIALGVKGITIHPRPDERHIRYQDARDLSALLRHSPVELNIEGNPGPSFMALVEETRPDQCTLVPDGDDQLTSDHGWNFHEQGEIVSDAVTALKSWGVRSSVFLDPDPGQAILAAKSGADRIELYTEHFASTFGTQQANDAFESYRKTAETAQAHGLGLNAGHDLDLKNLPRFLEIPGILEVSIGHALIVECIDHGMEKVIQNYLRICARSARL